MKVKVCYIDSTMGMSKDIEGILTSTNDAVSYAKPAIWETKNWKFAIAENYYTPERVIFHKPATIIYWQDGTKTVAKCKEGETFSEEMGFQACLMKKLYGSYKRYMEIYDAAYRVPEREPRCKHKWHMVWLTDDLEGYKCAICGKEVVEK